MLTTIPHGYDEVRATYGDLVFGPDGRVTRAWQTAHLMMIPLPYALENHALPNLPPLTHLYGHALIADNLIAALREVQRLGLGQRDVGDARYDGLYACGGCWNVRAIRGRPGFWSIHSWGAAIDFNVRENPLGADPGRMHPDVVAAFAHAGWVWGGDFHGRKDPQHFQCAADV